MSEQDQNSPDNRRDFEEGESQNNTNTRSGSTPEEKQDSAGENFSPDESAGEVTGDDLSKGTHESVPPAENEEPVGGAVSGIEANGEKTGEEGIGEAAEEVPPDAPGEGESGLQDEGEEAPGERPLPADEEQVEMHESVDSGEYVSPDRVGSDEPPAEYGGNFNVYGNADDADEPVGIPGNGAETPQTVPEDRADREEAAEGGPGGREEDMRPEQPDAEAGEPSGGEAEVQEAGSSLEGLGEITAAEESGENEEASQREEVVDDLAHIIESIVFASDEPLPVSTIKSVLDAARTFGRVNPDMITGRISALNAKYDDEGSGFRIVEIANGYQYATRKEMAQWVSNLFKERSKRRLSNSALETVAIIAYKQPITKPEIESIRGVSVDYVLHNLLEKELVTVVGRAETVGRPLLYGTTQKFLKIFALKNLEDLPKLREIDEIIKEIKSKGAEESIQLEITALGDSSAPEQENNPGESSENGTE